MYLRSRCLPMIMTSSITTACCGVTGVCGKSIGNGIDIFVHFFTTPCRFWTWLCRQKAKKQRFQRYIVRTEIFSTFHARVEYISVKTVISVYRRRAAMTPQSIYRMLIDGEKENKASHDISPVHLADIITKISVKATTYYQENTSILNVTKYQFSQINSSNVLQNWSQWHLAYLNIIPGLNNLNREQVFCCIIERERNVKFVLLATRCANRIRGKKKNGKSRQHELRLLSDLDSGIVDCHNHSYIT